MKKLLITIALAAWLGGCATTGDAPADREAFIRQVQQITAGLCNFVPVVSTITNIVTAGQYSGAFAIATAICEALNAVPRAAGKDGKRPPAMVGKVVVRGYYLKGK